ILDLKGDTALFHAVKRSAESEGRRFRFLTANPNLGYYFFDPFQCFSGAQSLPISDATDWIRAFGMDYGLVYAGKYFTDQNIVILKDALTIMSQLGDRPSLGNLSRILGSLARQPGKKDAAHIQLCIDMLAQFPQLNDQLHIGRPYPQIDLVESLAAGDVI